MSNHLTYSENNSIKWLTAVFLAFSCFAFSISPVASSARQSLPTQIEQVVSTNEKNGDSTSLHHVFLSVRSFHVNHRSREYEKNLISIHQKESKVQFESISEKLFSFHFSDRFQYSKTVPQDSDEEFSPFALV